MTKKARKKSIEESLRNENKRLRKALGRANKQAKKYLREEVEDIEEEKVVAKEVKENCPKCKEGLMMKDLGKRILYFCEACTYKKSYASKKD